VVDGRVNRMKVVRAIGPSGKLAVHSRGEANPAPSPLSFPHRSFLLDSESRVAVQCAGSKSSRDPGVQPSLRAATRPPLTGRLASRSVAAFNSA
jgi:hypothetical protein